MNKNTLKKLLIVFLFLYILSNIVIDEKFKYLQDEEDYDWINYPDYMEYPDLSNVPIQERYLCSVGRPGKP